MATDQKNSSGYSLPAPGSGATPTPSASPTQINTSPVNVILPPGETFSGTYTVVSDTPARDMIIGGGVLLALFVAFFFAKNAYANTLVAKRVSPNGANLAGWWMFILLGSLATGAVLVAVNTAKFLSLLFLGPLGGLALIALIMMLISSRK